MERSDFYESYYQRVFLLTEIQIILKFKNILNVNISKFQNNYSKW